TGPEISGLLARGDQTLLAGRTDRPARSARLAKGHDAREARATGRRHRGYRRNAKPAANESAGVGIYCESDPGDANVTNQRLAQKILFRCTTRANGGVEQAVIHRGAAGKI